MCTAASRYRPKARCGHIRVAMTPHIAAVTRPAEAVAYITHTISEMEQGHPVTGQVDRQRGY